MAAKANPYGVTIAVFNTSPYAYSAQLFPDIATIGLGCVRFQQSWSLIEGTKGVYNWSALDDMVGRCNANGLFIQFPIRGAPAWYMTTLVNPGQTNRTTCNTNFPNDRIYNMDATAAGVFAGILAHRYNGTTTPNSQKPGTFLFIDAIEIGNEDFDVFYDCNAGTGVGYLGQEGRLAKWYNPVVVAAAPAIRTNSPNTLVGMFGSWWKDNLHRTQFLTDMYNGVGVSGQNVAALLDYFNFHFYHSGSDPNVDITTLDVSLPHVITNLYNVVTSHSDTKHFWVTEIGWTAQEFSGDPTDPTEATIATYYQEALDEMRTSGVVDRFNLFTMAYTTQAAGSWAAGKSLTQPTGYSPHLEPAAFTIQSYINNYPQWNVTAATVPLSVSSTSLSFTAPSDGSDPASQSVTLTNPNSASVSYTTSSSVSWLRVSPASGTVAGSNGTATSSISASGVGNFAPGTYSGAITYVTPYGSTVVTCYLSVLTTVVPATFYGQGVYENHGPQNGPAFYQPRLNQIAAAGFKLVMNYDLLFGHASDITAYINYAATVGLQVIVALNNPVIWKTNQIAATFPNLYADSGNQSTDNGFTTYVVNLVKGLPGTWGYYVADEVANSDHAALLTHANYIKAADPNHPRLIISNGASTDAVYTGTSLLADCCEVLGDDYYPIGDSAAYANSLTYRAQHIQNFCNGKNIYSAISLQAHSLAPYNILGPWPTLAQMQANLATVKANMYPRLILWYSYFDVIATGSPEYAPPGQFSALAESIQQRSGIALFPATQRRGIKP